MRCVRRQQPDEETGFVGVAPAPSLGAAPSLAPVGDGYDPAQLAYVPNIYSQPAPTFLEIMPYGAFSRSPIAAPELAPSYNDVLPYGGPPLSSMPAPEMAPMVAPSPAPSRSMPSPFDQSLPPLPSLTALLPGESLMSEARARLS